MAFQTATYSSIGDLFTKLSTFAVAVGWTQDFAASDRLFLNDGASCFMSFRWASSSPTCAGIYQALGFINSGTDPGSHTNDSGQGAVSGTNATILAGRSVPLNNSGGTYWFFSGGATPDYIHVVVTVAGGDYRHFGFGNMTKIGTWTGGEYSYGQSKPTTTAGATQVDAVMMLDGIGGSSTGTVAARPFGATLHCESLPNEGASSKWGMVWGGGIPSTNDRAGVARVGIQGGFRGGPAAFGWGRYSGTLLTGLVPMYPIDLYYKDITLARYYPLGYMPDVRGVHMLAFVGGQEVTVSTDTWIVFPSKALATFGSNNTGYQGVAYKKVP